MTNPEVFRPRSSYAYAAIAWLSVLGMVWADSVGRNLPGAVGSVLIGGAVAYAAHLVILHPKVTLYDEGIVITNPLSEHTIGWQEVEHIGVRYTMSVHVDGADIHAWAAPAQGRYHTRTLHPADVRHLRGGEVDAVGTLQVGDSPRAHSGVAAHMARVRLRTFEGPGTVLRSTSVRRRRIYALAACMALGLLLH